MGKFLDFQQLKEAFDFDDAIEFLGLKLNAENNQLRGKCPACNSGGARGLVITPGRGYFCFGAKKGGDQIALVAHVKGIGMRDAAMLIQEELVPAVPASTRTSRTVPDKHPERDDSAANQLAVLDYLQHDHEMVQAIGFTAEDAEALGIGYCAKGTLRGHVAVPVRLEDGTLSGYVGIDDAKLPTRWHGLNIVPFRKRA